jgi:hypothetical protein
MDSLVAYMGTCLNQHVKTFRAMGSVKAADKADLMVSEFHDIFSLSKEHGTIDIQSDDICLEFNAFVRTILTKDAKDVSGEAKVIRDSIIEKDGNVFIQRPVKTMCAFIEWRYPRATAGRLYPKVSQIIKDFYGETTVVRSGFGTYKVVIID